MRDLSVFKDGRNSPARKLKKGKFGKHIVHFPSLKNKKTIVCESELEADLCLHFEYEPSVLGYLPQPDTFKFIFDDKVRTYTPDFLATYDTGEQVYYEVKPDHIEGNEYYKEMIRIFSEKVGKSGYSYKLVLERDIRVQPRINNLQTLYNRIAGVTRHEHAYLMDTLLSLDKEKSIQDLISIESPPSFRSIANAIFFQAIEFDIDSPFGPYSYISLAGA